MKRLLKWLLLALLLCAILFIGLRYGTIFFYKWRLAKQQDQIARNVESLDHTGGKLFLYSLDPNHRTSRDTNMPPFMALRS